MTDDRPTVQWFKSSRSQHGGECVEVCHAADRVGVRDSKHPGGPELWFSGEAWDAFLSFAVAAGVFD